ncbi:TPA: tetratricopeptide repeat protein [Candidatus Poribacteria bacterium]|nr:tetratricopeptide repeat protein [Candidatus Poribacteria bacterium]
MERSKKKQQRDPKPQFLVSAADIEDKFQQAVAFHQAGQLSQAEKICKQILTYNSQNAEVFHFLGIIACQVGKYPVAVDLITQAIEIDSKQPPFYYSLANALREQGKLEKATEAYQQVIQIQPNHADAYNNLGTVFINQDRIDDAIEAYQQAIRIQPNQGEAYYNLGNAFHSQERMEEAIEAYQKAIQIQPNRVEAYNNLGVVLIDQEKLEESVQIYQKTLEIQPNYADAYNNLGNALREQGKLEESIRIFQKATHLQPNHAEAHNNLAMMLLLKGNFENGWKQYEWRCQCDNFPFEKRDFPQPFWEGTDLNDKSILVWTEQGIGDEIMFTSILPDLLNMNANIIVESDRRMVSLFQRSFPKIQFIPRQNPPNSQLLNTTIDYQVPIGSLGKWLRRDENSFILNRNTYLCACPKKTSRKRKEYQELANGKILIGISWKSTGINQRHTYTKKKKSTPLEYWQPLLAQRNCYFINLQYGNVKQELNEFQKHTDLKIYQDEEIDSLSSLDDFAAQISALDLVISTSNTTVHLAGALGKQVWTLLPHIPDWRWTLEREDTLWYPRMRLFRQHRIGDWSKAFQQVKLALEQHPTNKNT